jgi:hypothetical protein
MIFLEFLALAAFGFLLYSFLDLIVFKKIDYEANLFIIIIQAVLFVWFRRISENFFVHMIFPAIISIFLYRIIFKPIRKK